MTRHVLITGGGTGIGAAIARKFSDSGDSVTIVGRRLEPLETLAAEIGATAIRGDVTNEEEIARVFDQPFDIVIANAGIGHAGKVSTLALDDWNKVLNVNLTGVFLTFREALKDMPSGGRLIAIASTAALKGGNNLAAYAASKHGVLGLVRSLAHEVAKSGITCNAVCPGFVETEMAQGARRNVMAKTGVDYDKATAMLAAGNPLSRMIAPVEVAAAAHFLASAEANSVNGHALSVSGGEI